ncbi:ribokinase [Lachnospiraceae bacterium KM106-2]|nr:ribokinase [Lachnospiraceae bacterium KM106-2]
MSSRVIISGLLNTETTVKVKGFPIEYYPIDYPFFGVHSSVSGVGYNIAKALKSLEDDITLASYLGKDMEAELIMEELDQIQVKSKYILRELRETPSSVVLYEESGRRQIYCDLKDIQEKEYPIEKFNLAMRQQDLIILCNINFNRGLLKKAKESGTLIASDVHVISDIKDTYNSDFMKAADILFLSNEGIRDKEREMLARIKDHFENKIIVVGKGDQGVVMYERKTDRYYELPCVTVGEVVNTVGAGDALFGSFLHYFMQGMDPVECLKRAELFASYKIGFNGAATGFATEQIVEQLYDKYPIEVQIVH